MRTRLDGPLQLCPLPPLLFCSSFPSASLLVSLFSFSALSFPTPFALNFATPSQLSLLRPRSLPFPLPLVLALSSIFWRGTPFLASLYLNSYFKTPHTVRIHALARLRSTLRFSMSAFFACSPSAFALLCFPFPFDPVSLLPFATWDTLSPVHAFAPAWSLLSHATIGRTGERMIDF
jgi:hypothetical protein